jgi:hypothetical protein
MKIENLTLLIIILFILLLIIYNKTIADFMRIHVLNQNGEIWLDASIILHNSLDWIFNIYQTNFYEFIGYRIMSKETNRNKS